MELIQNLDAILQDYLAAVQELQKGRKLFDGLLGMGSRPGDAPCHDELDKKIAALCAQAAELEDADGKAAFLEALFQAEGSWTGPEYARWMLVAVQRHALAVIPALPEESRRAMAVRYEKKYPRRRRLPVQDQLLAALKK